MNNPEFVTYLVLWSEAIRFFRSLPSDPTHRKGCSHPAENPRQCGLAYANPDGCCCAEWGEGGFVTHTSQNLVEPVLDGEHWFAKVTIPVTSKVRAAWLKTHQLPQS